MNHFSGMRVLTGCALFIFIVMSGSGLYSAGYPMIAETFALNKTMLGTYSMLLSLAGIVSSLLLTKAKKLVGLKGVLYYDALLFLSMSVISKTAGARLSTLLWFFFVIGSTLTTGAHAVQTEIVSNWYVEGRTKKISIILGCAMLGQAFFQFLGGQVLSRMALLDTWCVFFLVNGVLLMVTAKFIIIAVTPEEIGQAPCGGRVPPLEDKKDYRTEKGARPAKGSRTIYADPAFWLCVLGRLGLCGGVNYITTYAAMFFIEGGLSLESSTLILSAATISAAVFSFLNGQILDALKSQKYILFLMSGVILGNLGMVLYSHTASVALVFLIVLCYGMGYSGSHCMNLVAGILFDRESAADANSKIYGFGMIGGLAMLPLTGAMVDGPGYSAMYFLIIALAAVSLVSF